MSKNQDLDLGQHPVVLVLGANLEPQGFCKCGKFSSQLDHGLCPYCRAGGTSPVVTPTAIPTKPNSSGGK